jgi:phospholipid/cholesterol/gamma-HCH transport system substrate-binding protein
MIRILNTMWGKIAVLAVFLILSLIYLGYLFGKAGVDTPFVGADPYTVSFETKDIDNGIPPGDVKMAGVTVGAIEQVHPGNGMARVVLQLDPKATPLHQGAIVRVGAKSIAGETYLDIKDGKGKALESGSQLPNAAVERGAQLADVIGSFDPKTRESLRGLMRTAGAGTAGSRQDVSAAMTGLGNIGREGYTAVDAISAQSKDLTTLARQTTDVLGALNTGQGQIATLVDKANELTSATGGQQHNLADSIRKLPGTLSSTQTATGKLGELSSALGPVASDLRSSAPYLNTALHQLPATTSDLRGLLPDLNGTLKESPATLDRVPRLAQEAGDLVPQARQMMTQLNPMLSYLSPYGPELGSFFANFGSIFNYVDEKGTHFFRLQPDLGNESVVKGVPLKLPGVLTSRNPYPAPGDNMGTTGRQFTKLYSQPN